VPGLLILLAFLASVQAGTIQGVVLENISGRPLARTVVRLEPVSKAGVAKGQPLATRAGRSGHFVFPSIAPGIYILTASRDEYFPVAYGQRLAVGRGTAIPVTTETDLFAELRLRHKGALTGRVLDENGVATAGVTVVAYRARLPLRSSGSAVADDRGVFRIHDLVPGKYWIRSAAHTMDDGSGWLPTFGPQAREVREARTHQVTVDADTTDTDVNPEPGSLFRLGGMIYCDTGGPVTVTLSSETGRRRTRSSCPKGSYQFEGLAPAVYEVYATLEDGTAAGFIELFLDQDNIAGTVQVMQSPAVEFEVRRPGSNNVAADIPLTLIGRRQDVAETDASREISQPRTTLAPGHWEFRAQVPAGQYVESIANVRNPPRRTWKAERSSDWYDVFIEQRAPSRIRITVSDQAGQITGKVMADSTKPVAAAPVFLWPVAESARRSLNGPLQMLTDTDGRFRFDSLPPGDYRVLASFDINEIDQELLELSHAPVVHADASQTATIDLPVWIAP
jgi:protocatechuate 3,4-dioxygenase beta subunit